MKNKFKIIDASSGEKLKLGENPMSIDQREAELNNQFEAGIISQKEWAKLWVEALEDEESYPNEEETK